MESIKQIKIRKEDLKYLINLKKKYRLGSVWAVVEKIVKQIKLGKWEKDIF